MKEKNPIDELFKKGLEKKELTPSDAVWSKIEETLEPEESKRGGFYLMRAAVVTILVGLSSWVFLVNTSGPGNDDFSTEFMNGTELFEGGTDINKQPDTKPNTAKKKDTPKGKQKGSKADEPKKTSKTEKGPKKPINPIMKGSKVSRSQFVSNTQLKELPIAMEDFSQTDEPLIASEELQVKSNPQAKKFKIKYRVPVTEQTYYGDNGADKQEETSKPKLKERVFAYASNQFDNLLKGEPLELPKTDSKVNPQLEINLGSIFSDN